MIEQDKRFFGIYLGICVDNDDPDEMSRIKLQVPQVLGQAISEWALPCLPVTSNANHPDHLPHLASEVAALLTAHGNHSATFTTSTDATHSHTVAVSFSHTNNHTGKTPDTTYYLDHEHEDTSATDPYDTQTVSPEHTYHRTIPNIKQKVWVMFVAGDPNFPVWMGVM